MGPGAAAVLPKAAMMTLPMLTEGATMAAGQQLLARSPFRGETLALPDTTYSSLRSPNRCVPPAERRLHGAEGAVVLLLEARSRRLNSAGGPSGWISRSTDAVPDVGPPSVVWGARMVATPVPL